MQKVAFWIISISICLFMVVSGIYSYDPPGIDSNAFAPAAISLRQGHGFVNPVFQTAYVVDRQTRFVYHGPLYPLVLSLLMPKPDAPSAILVTRSFNALSFLLGSLLFYQIAFRKHRKLPWLECGVAMMSLLAMATLGWTDLRPESLAAILVIIGILTLYFRGTSVYSCLILGVFAGALAVTQPTVFLIANALLMIYWSCFFRYDRILFNYLLVAAPAILFGVIFFAFIYPYPFLDWLAGMQAHAVISTGGANLKLLIPTLILSPYLPFAGLVLVYGFLIALFYTLQYRKQIVCLPLFTTGAILFVLLIYYFGLSIAFRNYVLVGVWTLLIAAITYFAIDERTMFSAKWILPVQKLLPLILVSVLSLGFLRHFVLFNFYVHEGMSLPEARSRFEDFAAKNQGVYALSDSMWTLSEGYSRLIHTPYLKFDQAAVIPNRPEYISLPKKPAYAVLQQYRHAVLMPRQLEGWQLVEDSYSRTQPKVLGVRIANTTPGYQFAVYKRIEP